MQALKGVSLCARRRRVDAADGPVRQRQDDAALDARMHADADAAARCGSLGRSTTGARPEELAALRREHVGFIFQSYHLFPTLTAAENVRLVLDVRGERLAAGARPRPTRRSRPSALSHKVNSFPRELSGGEQQRVAIARAIVGNASAILADEPTGALDSENGYAIMKVLAVIAKDRVARRLGRHSRPAYIAVRQSDRPHRGRTHRRRGADHSKSA